MSPKSLIQVIGPAPSGRSVIWFSRCPISWNSCWVFLMLSNSLTCTTEMLSWVVDSTRSTLLFPVMACSTFRVTSLSTLSAEIPGQGGNGQRNSHRYVRIVPLGHVHVTEHAQGKRGEQGDPGNLPVVDKESCHVTTAIGVFGFH